MRYIRYINMLTEYTAIAYRYFAYGRQVAEAANVNVITDGDSRRMGDASVTLDRAYIPSF
jgi:hypothetical protein